MALWCLVKLLIIHKNLFSIRWRFAVERLENSIFETDKENKSTILVSGESSRASLQHVLNL